MHRLLLIIVFILLTNACSQKERPGTLADTTAARNYTKPNVVFVITDDQGYGDLSAHGNPIVRTPNIDALANESVSLTDYHVAPTCSPTRAALLTGHWTNRTGVWHTIMGRSMLRVDEKTLADLLNENGYSTAMFGKWHLGDNYPYRPMDRGFEQAYYHGGGGVGQTPDFWDNAYFDGSYFRNGVPEKARGFVTDVLFNEAMRYIDSVKDSGKPFFTYISTNAPHAPMHAPERYAALYSDENLSTFEQHFFGMISNIDDNVARLRGYLEKNQLSENTLFIFTTDNGTVAGENIFNANMRGKKGSPYDGGHRVPFFIHWPAGGIRQAKSVDTITSYVDIVPTLLDYTQSQNADNIKFDGVSLRPLISGENPVWPDRILVTDSQRVPDPIKWRQSSVMTDRWRMINGQELYDIEKDPAQENNIAGAHSDVMARLRSFYDKWWSDMESSFGEPTPIYVGATQANLVELTAHDWLGENRSVPWHQGHIRSALTEEDGVHKGYWWIKVLKEENYQIVLRRWPKEVDKPIHADIAGGEYVAGETAYRTTPGKGIAATHAFLRIDNIEQKKPVTPRDRTIVFNARLKVGTQKLAGGFTLGQGQELGAYYASIKTN